MNSRERVLAALNRRKPDRVPTVLYGELVGYVPKVKELLETHCGIQSPPEYFKYDVATYNILPSKARNNSLLKSGPGMVVDEWGVGWKQGEYSTDMVHPLVHMDKKILSSYPFPDLDKAYRYAESKAKVEEIQKRGIATAKCPEGFGSIFETAWYMRGMEQLYVDMMTEPDLAHDLFDRITEIVAASAYHIAKAGTDILMLGDDISGQTGLMMSLDTWRTFLKFRLKKVIDAAKSANPDILIFYHSCGRVWDAIPDLIDVGVEVLNPIQPDCMDPAEVKREFGNHLSFWGTVSVQYTLSSGTPNDVKKEVKLRMETIGKGGGLLIAPAHVLQADTPWENIVAFFEAVEEFGYYD